MRRVLCLLLAGLLLAGCSSPEKVPAEPSETAPPPSADPSIPAGLVAARFPDAATLDRTIWANGTLRPEQASGVTGYGVVPRPTNAPAATIEVTELAATGLPVILEGTLESSMTQGSATIRFSIPREDGRNNAFGPATAGKHHVESGLVRTSDDPIFLNLFYRGLEPGTEVPYTLNARVRTDPTVIRAAFPVGITVAEDAEEILVDLLGEKRSFGAELETANLMLWGPDDSFLGHYALAEARTTIALSSGGGEYVALLSQGGRSIRVLTEGTEPATLRSMAQEFTINDPQSGSATEAQWTSTYDKVPVLAGLLVAPSTASQEVALRMESPSGVLLDGIEEGPIANVPLVPDGMVSYSIQWDSSYGVPNLVAGEYTATVTAPTGAGADPITGQDYAAFWKR